MDTELAARLGVSPIPLAEPISARTLRGTQLNRITHSTKFITLTLSGKHAEEIHFLLIHSFSMEAYHDPRVPSFILRTFLHLETFTLFPGLRGRPWRSVYT